MAEVVLRIVALTLSAQRQLLASDHALHIDPASRAAV